MPFCAIYTRVSSDLQDVDASLSAQETELRARAERDGYTVYEVFRDEAISGRSLDRPAFQRMVSFAKKTHPPFTRIYLWDIRRWGRNHVESAVYKQRLRARGIEIVYLKENIGDTNEGRLIEGIIEVIAEFESCNIAEDTRRGHREITRRGYIHGGAAPYGYRHKRISEGDRKRVGLEPDPERASTVKWMYDQRLAGKSPGAIAKELNEKRIPASRGGPWNGESVRKLLENPIYIGRLEYGRQSVSKVDGRIIRKSHQKENWTVCEEACEAIMERETWEAVQNMLKLAQRGRRWNGSRVYLLTGLLTCDRCGGSMIGGGHADGHRVYYCRSGKSQGICDRRIVRADSLEEKVLGAIGKRLSGINIDKIVREYTTQKEDGHAGKRSAIEAQKREMAKIQKGIDNLMASIAEGMPAKEVMGYVKQHTERKEALAQEIQMLERDIALDTDLEAETLRLALESLEYAVSMPENPEALRTVLQRLCTIRYNIDTGRGEIRIFLPQETETPISFSVFDENQRLIDNRSGPTSIELPPLAHSEFWLKKRKIYESEPSDDLSPESHIREKCSLFSEP